MVQLYTSAWGRAADKRLVFFAYFATPIHYYWIDMCEAPTNHSRYTYQPATLCCNVVISAEDMISREYYRVKAQPGHIFACDDDNAVSLVTTMLSLHHMCWL